MQGIYSRPKGEFDSTDFSNSRFLVPYLSGYRGWSVFMDCDMVVLGDVIELAHFMSLHSRWTKAVHVVQHDYTPKEKTKFLGAIQSEYKYKNWSSVMVFNNEMCRELTPENVNTKPGLWLHQFKWTTPDKIGKLPPAWNYLVGEENNDASNIKLIHYTKGTPCFKDYADSEYAEVWHAEREDMLSHA